MIDQTVSAYEQFLKQFYRKAIRTHPYRNQLQANFLKRAPFLKEQKQILEPQSPVLKINRPNQKNLQIPKHPQSKAVSSKQVQPQSAKLSKKYSDQKSQISGDSDISRQRKRNRDQQKYFGCQWIYKTTNFKKILSFALIYMYFQGNQLYSFTKLKDYVQTYFQQNSNIDAQIKNAVNQWSKLDQTFQKKDRVRWTKILPQIFLNLPIGFINIIFEGTTRIKPSHQQLKNPNKQLIQLISRNIKINLNYFEIFHQQIEKSFDKIGSYKNQINIGYVKQQNMYVFSNKFPQKSEQQIKKQKVIKNISQSIANLLKQYDANTQKLLNLDILSQTNSTKETNIKNYLSKKDVLK